MVVHTQMMFVRCLFITFFILSAINASDTNYDVMLHESSTCEEKISAILFTLKTEMFSKLDIMNENFKILNNEINELKKKIPAKLNEYVEKNLDLAENIREKLHKQENNILEKVEEYIDEKLDLSAKRISRKIDALEKVQPDKVDIHVLNHKLDELKIIQDDLDKTVISKTETLTNETLHTINEGISRTLEIEDNYTKSVANNTTYLQLDAVDKKITNLQDKFNNKWTELKNMIPQLEKSVNSKMDALNKKIPEHFEDSINHKLDSLDKTLHDLKEKSSAWDILNNSLTKNISNSFDEIKRKFPEMEKNINRKIDALEIIENNILTVIKREGEETSKCKKTMTVRSNSLTPFYRINETLTHVTHTTDSNGQTYFEMHFGIKGDVSATITLSPTSNMDQFKVPIKIDFGYFNNDKTCFFVNDGLKSSKPTPNILNSSQFTAFYIKIENGTVKIAHEGSDTPIITHSEDIYKTISVQYIGFGAYKSDSTFIFDCPPFAVMNP